MPQATTSACARGRCSDVEQARGDDGGDRHVLDDRLPQVEAGDLLQEGQVLHHQRPVEQPSAGACAMLAVAVSGTSR